MIGAHQRPRVTKLCGPPVYLIGLECLAYYGFWPCHAFNCLALPGVVTRYVVCIITSLWISKKNTFGYDVLRSLQGVALIQLRVFIPDPALFALRSLITPAAVQMLPGSINCMFMKGCMFRDSPLLWSTVTSHLTLRECDPSGSTGRLFIVSRNGNTFSEVLGLSGWLTGGEEEGATYNAIFTRDPSSVCHTPKGGF